MIGSNNVLNIRYSRLNYWLGMTGYRKGFCEFVSRQYGIRAACIIIMRSYRKRHIDTVRGVIYEFAPPCENDTERYVATVVNLSGLDPDRCLAARDYPALISAMSYMEVGFKEYAPVSEVVGVINRFNIKYYGEKENCQHPESSS